MISINYSILLDREDKFSDFGEIAWELPGTTLKHPPLPNATNKLLFNDTTLPE